MRKRLWLDTHVHVNNQGPDGEDRPRLLEDLLAVLDGSGADLRFVINEQNFFTYFSRHIHTPPIPPANAIAATEAIALLTPAYQGSPY